MRVRGPCGWGEREKEEGVAKSEITMYRTVCANSLSKRVCYETKTLA